MIGDEGGIPSGAAAELEAPRFPSNTIFALTDTATLYAFHKNLRDGLIGRWPLAEVGAKLTERESNWNHLELVGTWELLLSFPDGRSGAFESSKRDEDCRATNGLRRTASEAASALPRRLVR